MPDAGFYHAVLRTASLCPIPAHGSMADTRRPAGFRKRSLSGRRVGAPLSAGPISLESKRKAGASASAFNSLQKIFNPWDKSPVQSVNKVNRRITMLLFLSVPTAEAPDPAKLEEQIHQIGLGKSGALGTHSSV